MADINVTYQVYTGGRWLPNVTNLNDYAGIYGQPIQGVYASLSRGTIQYRTHTQGGSWLPWVTNRTDYAGVLGKNVDGLQMQLVSLSGYNVRYRVYVGGRWLPWVTGTSDYAGIYGQPIEGIQVEIISTDLTNSQILARSGNYGLFNGLGISFGGFDAWQSIALLSTTPPTTLQAKVSFRSHLGGSTVDISVPNALATTIRSQLLNAGVSLDGKLSVGNLSATFNSVTATANIDKNVKVSVITTPTSMTIEIEALADIGGGVKVYQSLRISMTNMRPYEYALARVTIPVVTSYTSDKKLVYQCAGALVLLLALYLAAPAIVAYGGAALSARLLTGI